MTTIWNTDPYFETDRPTRFKAAAPYRPPFSRAIHFATILGPVVLGLAVMVVGDTSATLKQLIQVTGYTFAYTATVLLLLKGVEKVESDEARQPSFDKPFAEEALQNAA